MVIKQAQTFNGFSALAVEYASSKHFIYARLQVGSSSGKSAIAWPENRTLFMVNLPPDATEREVVLFFRSCGTIERIVFDSDAGWGLDGEDDAESSDDEGQQQAGGSTGEGDAGAGQRKRKRRNSKKGADESAAGPPAVVPLPPSTVRRLRRTGHTAHVIFLDASACTRALALASKPDSSKPTSSKSHVLKWPRDPDAPLGLQHYLASYESLRPPLDVVLAHANSSVELYDYEQAEKKRALRDESKYRKGEAIVDEDGFTLVTRGGAYGKAVGGGVGVASKKFMLENAKRPGAKDASGRKKKRHRDGDEKAAFYAFQIHEKKRKALLDLKKKWEEDKAAVEKLKASRKFKPY